jgi:hypothetical protein
VTGVVVIALGAGGVVWATHSDRGNAPQNDCAAIEQLGHEWAAMQKSVTALENGPGETKDLIAIANQESAMSDTIRAAQTSVTAQELKNQLGQWADGTALGAKGQRDAATDTSQPGTVPAIGADADSMRAGTMIYNATTALRRACPNMPVS